MNNNINNNNNQTYWHFHIYMVLRPEKIYYNMFVVVVVYLIKLQFFNIDLIFKVSY